MRRMSKASMTISKNCTHYMTTHLKEYGIAMSPEPRLEKMEVVLLSLGQGRGRYIPSFRISGSGYPF